MMSKRKITIIFSWLLVVACMATVFYLSSRPADESREMSDWVIDDIFNLFGLKIPVFYIRKAAHVTEFTVLAMLGFNAVYVTCHSKYTGVFAFLISAIYGVTDEIHQIFVSGRACQLRDMLIDSGGALIGALLAILILKTIKTIKERGKQNGCSQTV